MNYGIVAEFNPFHNGHRYIVDKLKDNGANTVTAVMSGSFVQRGECACASPYERTEMALKNGVDLVLSLPVPYATASAERFSQAGVDILCATGVINALGFGSECGNKALITECAKALLRPELDEYINKFLSDGVSFPDARQKALAEIYGEELSSVVATPNDILGVEYTKAILNNEYDIDIFPIKRIGASHDSTQFSETICSASAIRGFLKNNSDVSRFLPGETVAVLSNAISDGKAPANFKNVEGAMMYKLRTMSVEDFSQLPDVSEGLEHRIYSAVRSCVCVDEILEKIKTKRYTHSRLRRILLCAFLGIRKADVQIPVPYIRVLGFNKNGAGLLKQMKKSARLPVVTKSSDVKALDENAGRVFELECAGRDLFSLALPVPDICGKEMTDKIIVL